jgi:hypothetical protein
MFINKAISFPIKIITTLFIFLIVGCSSTEETKTPESPTAESVSPVIQETELTIPPTPTALPASEPIPEGLVQIPVSDEVEETVSQLRDAEHPVRDDYRLARELLGLQPEQLIPEVPDPAAYEVNDRDQFYITSRPGGYDNKQIYAYIRHISENAIWWKSANAKVTDAEIASTAELYEETVRPINHLAFGREPSPGIDNDRRVHFLLINEKQYGRTFGYFKPWNEFPTALYPESNQREMLVVNTYEKAIDSLYFVGKLAHEFQHLIHWNLDPNEDQWLNEAMAELAYFFTGAPDPRNQIFGSNSQLFAENPDIQLTARPERKYGEDDKSSLMHYAAEKSFMIYLLEQFGAEFIKDVANNPDPGVFSVQEELDKLPESPRFEEVFANWLVANLIDRPQIAEGQFGYKDYDPYLIRNRRQISALNEEPIEEQLPPYGAHYYQIQASDAVKVSFAGSTLARLTPADPPSGQFAWYSNRGDQSEFTLTNTFDLTGLDTATFDYKVWYELEEYWDFTYVEVSTDGGESWQILETTHGTDQDPIDMSYGVGYTGTTLEWLSESIDLSQYTGQEIQLRFHVLNDFATNRDGFQVDDIAIPEMGYFDSAEDDSGGWEAKGFIRSSNLVPAEWIVWLVKASNPFQVDRIALSPDQTAEFEIEGLGEDFRTAVVIVSPTAPVTTMELNYELVFQHP